MDGGSYAKLARDGIIALLVIGVLVGALLGIVGSCAIDCARHYRIVREEPK